MGWRMRRSTAVSDDSPVTFRTAQSIPVLTPDAARILLAILRSGDSAAQAATHTYDAEEAS